MDVDSKPMMEETILVGDDLMMGPPSPLVPPETASQVLEGVDSCGGILRNLFLCLQINDIEPFCQDEIALYRHCAERRDNELRGRLQDSERKLGMPMPLELAKERSSHLEAEATQLKRHQYHTNQKAEISLHDYEAKYDFYRDLVKRPRAVPFISDKFEFPPVMYH